MIHPPRVGLLALALAALTACEPEPSATPAPVPPAPPPATSAAEAPSGSSANDEAQRIFTERCVTCHGANGAGDGPASAGLTPKPRNFQDPDWQQSVTDEHIEQIVQYGGAAVGKSPAMPANPDLMSKPEVVAALREHIRNLSK